jgi:Tfp pilus assembly protein PilN
LARVQAFLAAAGLAARRVVPGGAAVAASLGNGAAEVLIALADADDLTLLVSRGGRCTWQRSVPAGADGGDARTQADLRRAALVVPAGDEAPLSIVGNGRAAAAAQAVLAPRAGAGDAARRSVRTVPPEALVESLAASQAALRRPALNLLVEHTRDRRADLRRVLRVAAPAAVVLVALLAWFAISWIGARSTIAATRARLHEIAGQVERAEHLRQLSRAADPWFPQNPGYLDALRALALRFPQEGSIWLTSLEVSPDGEMTLTGQARQQSDVLTVLAGLEADEHFTQVSRHFLRPQGGGASVVAFSVSCRYRREASP